MQNILPILKTSRVRTASFSCVPNANILIASLECDSGMMKEFRISCSEDEAFYPTIPRDIPCVEFISEPASLSKVLSTFHSAVDVITIKSKQNETRTQEHLIELQTHVMHNGTIAFWWHGHLHMYKQSRLVFLIKIWWWCRSSARLFAHILGIS